MDDFRDASPEEQQAEIQRQLRQPRRKTDPGDGDETADYRQTDDDTFRGGLARYGVAARRPQPIRH